MCLEGYFVIQALPSQRTHHCVSLTTGCPKCAVGCLYSDCHSPAPVAWSLSKNVGIPLSAWLCAACYSQLFIVLPSNVAVTFVVIVAFHSDEYLCQYRAMLLYSDPLSRKIQADSSHWCDVLLLERNCLSHYSEVMEGILCCWSDEEWWALLMSLEVILTCGGHWRPMAACQLAALTLLKASYSAESYSIILPGLGQLKIPAIIYYSVKSFDWPDVKCHLFITLLHLISMHSVANDSHCLYSAIGNDNDKWYGNAVMTWLAEMRNVAAVSRGSASSEMTWSWWENTQ